MMRRACRCAAAAASLGWAAQLTAQTALPPSAWSPDAPSLAAPPVTSSPGYGVAIPTTPRPTPIPPAAAPQAPAPVAGAAGPAPTAGADGGEDIRDIRGPKNIFPLGWVITAAAAALLALGAAYALWRYWRRPRKPRPLTIAELALQRLEEIRRLLHPSTVREYSIAVSDIVRGYIEAQFNVTATHQTTEEFLHGLLNAATAALLKHRNLLSNFLTQCDVAKYAGVSLSLRIMESMHESARHFVIESSKPSETAPLPATHDSLPST